MTRAQVKSLLKRISQHWESEDPHGIVLTRFGVVAGGRITDRAFGGVWKEERWRLQCGGGIAGKSDTWWLKLLDPRGHCLGPMYTQLALASTLRQWRKWETP